MKIMNILSDVGSYIAIVLLLIPFLSILVELLFEVLVNLVKSLKVQYSSTMIFFALLLYILSYIPLICILVELQLFKDYISVNTFQTINIYASSTWILFITITTLVIVWQLLVVLISDNETLKSAFKLRIKVKSLLLISVLFNMLLNACEKVAVGAYSKIVNIFVDSNYNAKLVVFVYVILLINLLAVQYMHNIMPHIFGGDVFTLKKYMEKVTVNENSEAQDREGNSQVEFKI